MGQEPDIFAESLVVDLIFRIAAILFKVYQIGIHQLLHMMGDRGLGQLEHLHNGGTLQTILFFFDGLHDLDAVGIAQSFGDPFDPFYIDFLIHKCKCIDFISYDQMVGNGPTCPKYGKIVEEKG